MAAPIDQTPASGVSKRTALWIIGGVVGVVGLLVLLTGGDDDGPAAPPTTSVPVDTAPDEPTGSGTGSEIPPLNCVRLLDFDEVALVLEADEPDGRLISAFTFAQGERCVYQDADVDGNRVVLEPGTVDDFAEGAERFGSGAERLDGIGETAVWFPGDGIGSLTVAADSAHGAVLFRIEFARVGVDDATRRQRATELARIVLPRFPGIVLPEPEPPEPVEIEPVLDYRGGEPQPPPGSFSETRDAGIADGTWSEFEAHVAVLEHLVGDTVLEPPPGGFDPRTASRAVSDAHHYASSADPDEAAVIDDLIDRLFPAPGSPEPEAPDNGGDQEDASAAPAPGGGLGLAALAAPLQQVDDEEDEIQSDDPGGCTDLWMGLVCGETYGPLPGSGLAPEQFLVDGPAPDTLPVAGYDAAFIEEVRRGMSNAGLVLTAFPELPNFVIVLTDAPGEVEVLTDPRLLAEGDCGIVVHPSAATIPVVEMRQWIAFEMALCAFIHLEPERRATASDAWAAPAFFYYLSALAEPDGYLESAYLDQISTVELDTPLPARNQENVFFFLSAHTSLGTEGTLALVRSTPVPNTPAEVAATLAGTSGFDDLLHAFARRISDRALIDGAGRTYPDQKIAALTHPATPGGIIDLDFEPLGTDRVIVRVDPGMVACVEFTPRGELDIGFRDWEAIGDWSDSVPSEFPAGESVYVLTSVADGPGHLLEIDDVVDADEGCDPEEDEPQPIDVDDCPIECGSSQYYDPRVILREIVGG